MHISEGVLNSTELIGGAIVGGILLTISYRNLRVEDITKVGFFSALFFTLSFIHIPLGPTSVHLLGSGLLGYILGFGSVIAIFVALLFQGVLFGFGGITTLGINLVIMSLPAILVHISISKRSKKEITYFLVGFLGVLFSSILIFIVLFVNGEEFKNLAKIIFLANTPLAALEGVVTMFLLKFLEKSGYLERVLR